MVETLDRRMLPTKKIAIPRVEFLGAFVQNPYYSGDIEILYLNQYNGDIEELLDEYELADYGLDPEQIRYQQDKIQNNPEKYLLIEGISTEDDYLILLSFFDSDWTDDRSLKKLVKDCYQGSIDNWKKNLWDNPNIDIDAEEIINRWRRYKRVEINRMMEKFLHDNRVYFKWC